MAMLNIVLNQVQERFLLNVGAMPYPDVRGSFCLGFSIK